MTKKQRRNLNKKIHLMTYGEACRKIRWLFVRGKSETTYYNNLSNHLGNLARN